MTTMMNDEEEEGEAEASTSCSSVAAARSAESPAMLMNRREPLNKTTLL
jgi:hypothetical protein